MCFQMLLQKTWTSPRRSSFACEESRSNRWQRLRRRTTRLMQEQPGFKGSILSTRIRSWSTSAVSANIKVIGRVRIRRKLHSHTMAFINAPGPALTYLSQTIKQEYFQVVFSNATAEDVDLAKKKFVRVRREQIEQMASVCDEEQLGLCRSNPASRGRFSRRRFDPGQPLRRGRSSSHQRSDQRLKPCQHGHRRDKHVYYGDLRRSFQLDS